MNRTELALAACKGMTDEDLANRGVNGFPKMIMRKRKYATLARLLAMQNQALQAELESTRKELDAAKATIATLESLDVPVTDTSAAEGMLANIFKGQAH